MRVRLPFHDGHMRRKHPCTVCATPTRRTVPNPEFSGVRIVLCSRCTLPSSEELRQAADQVARDQARPRKPLIPPGEPSEELQAAGRALLAEFGIEVRGAPAMEAPPEPEAGPERPPARYTVIERALLRAFGDQHFVADPLAPARRWARLQRVGAAVTVNGVKSAAGRHRQALAAAWALGTGVAMLGVAHVMWGGL
jgi:hypothetical protein